MLQSIYISNYALIDELSINFNRGFNIITGETGAGKSIILGALGLILGQRAELNVLQDKERKCLVEGTFNIAGYGFESFFKQEELDYEDQTILRREITPSGKSRAFINDTPVNLSVLRELALLLIDIHSQHQNLALNNRLFQLKLVDVVAGNTSCFAEYSVSYQAWQKQKKHLALLKEEAEKAKAELDYFQFQYNQLNEANLRDGEQEELEAELGKLEHAVEIKISFGQFAEDLESDEQGILPQLKINMNQISKLANIMSEAAYIKDRIESVYLELKDLAGESSAISEKTEHNPERISIINERLDMLFTLEQKFRLGSVGELISLKNDLALKVQKIISFDEVISEAEKKFTLLDFQVNEQALKISKRRKSVAAKIEDSVTSVLQKLGMVNAVFKVQFEFLTEAGLNGLDDVSFLFSANKNSVPQEISKIASGGEISRLMLALKTLITDNKSLPTIVFDEIDTGISGEVAIKMGVILRELSVNMQVINITHLPQIAAKGQHHYKVYKYDEGDRTLTSIRQLDSDERIEELAQMLGGDRASDTTRETARELLN